MSLHAQISPEAQAALNAQKRNSTITAIVIALLTMVLICIILMYVLLQSFVKETPEVITYAAGVESEDNIEKPEVTNQVERKPSAPSTSMAKTIAANTASPLAIPVPIIESEEPSLDFGNGADFGEGWASGSGEGDGGGGFGNIPQALKKRCSKADRLERLAKEGGNPKCEDAVVNALRWMQKTQNKDGSWTDKKVSMTALSLLSYLGHCETPNSAEFGKTVTDAIVFLVNNGMKNKGSLSDNLKDKHWPYEHAIATYALAEAYTFCSKQNVSIPNLKEVVQKAGEIIIKNQHPSGSWDYFYAKKQGGRDRKGDSSIACWHLQALKACKHTGLDFTGIKSAANKGLKYLETCQQRNGAVYYTPKVKDGQTPTMTGGAMLCYQQWDKGFHSVVRKATKYATTVSFKYDESSADLYAHYYYGQALINQGGADWKNYNAKFRDEILNAQLKDGSYKNPGKGRRIAGAVTDSYQKGSYALHYRTCLNTLILEVYYRFLPGTTAK